MASKGKSTGGPSSQTGTDVSSMVESIRKHKKFKQLVSFSVQCLEKPLNRIQNRNSWEVVARAAFEAGALDDIADVCARFANDGEMFALCMSCLGSMAAVPKCLASLMANTATASLVIQAVGSFSGSLDFTSATVLNDVENRMKIPLDLLLEMARQDGASFETAGGFTTLLSMSSAASAAGKGRVNSAGRGAISSHIARLIQILDRATRNKAALDALATNDEYVSRLLALAAENAPAPSENARKSLRVGQQSSAISGDVTVVHLEPTLRILDRLARAEGGRDMLLRLDAIALLSPVVNLTFKDATLSSLAMRILGKLLGSNVSELLDRVAGTNPSGGAPPPLTERIMCARLLAFMATDEEYIGALMGGDGFPLLRKVIDLLDKPPLAISDGSTALLQVLRRVAETTSEGFTALDQLQVIAPVVSLLDTRQDNAEAVAEGVSLLAALVCTPDMAERLTSHANGQIVKLIGSACSRHVADADAALAGLRFLESLLLFEVSSERISSLLSAPESFAISAMKEHSEHVRLQIVATDVLVYLCSSETRTESAVSAGILPHIIRNLQAAGQRSEGNSQQQNATQEPKEEITLPDGNNLSLFTELVASTLFLLTSVCALERHVAAAKQAGIIKAVLGGFSKHSQDPNVYRNFKEVVSALQITEDEVTDAVRGIFRLTGAIQISHGETDAFKTADDYVKKIEAERGLPLMRQERDVAQQGDTASFADQLLASISLLEAVTVSPVFVCVVTANDGVPALVRVLGALSAVKMSTGAAKTVGNFGRQASVTDKGIAAHLADDILSRACNTLAHVARVSYEISAGQVEQDPEYEPVEFKEFGVGEDLHERDSVTLIARSMLAASKPNLRQFAVSSITLMSWLASGHGASEIKEHADQVINAQGVEAVVSMLRAHQASVDTCAAAAGALTRISLSPKGSSAVATRGGSRQIIRVLHSTAALRTNAADELLLAYLRLLDTVAAGGAEAADILRRQGLVDAVVACTDAGTDRDFRGEDEEEVATSSNTGAGSAYVPNPTVRANIDATIASILSRLVGPETVGETVSQLEGYVQELSRQVNSSSYSGRKALVLNEYAKAKVVRAVVRLGLLATTEAGISSGAATLQQGAQVLSALSSLGLRIGKVISDAGIQQPGQIEQEMEAAIPCALRSIKQVVNAIYLASPSEAEAGVANIAQQAVPVLLSVLQERPALRDQAVGCASVLASSDAASSLFLTGHAGQSLPLLVDAFRSAAERGEEDVCRDVVLTLAGIAKAEGSVAAVVSTGAVAIAQQFLSDNIAEAKPDTLAATFLLLAHTSADPSVAHDLVVNGQIFELIRTALQRHCADPYTPREPLLFAVAKLMQKLSRAYGVTTDPNHADNFRNAMRRMIRAAAGSTGYIDSARCSAALLNAITLGCCQDDHFSSELAAANRQVVVEAGAEDLVIQCMSSYAATQEVLDAGYAALQSLGASERAKQLVEQIDSYAAIIPQWLEGGYTAQSPEVIDMIAAMSELMKSLASQIVVSNGRAPELGSHYSDVLATCWRAVAVVCRADLPSIRSTTATPQPVGSNSGRDLHQAKADVLAVGAQIVGRLEAASQFARQGASETAATSLPVSDVVNVLYTVLATAHGALEVRVVESLGRAVEQLAEDLGEKGVHALCSGKVIAGLVSLLQVVHSETAKARLASASGTGFGASLESDGCLSFTDLAKCDAAIVNIIKNVVARLRTAFLSFSSSKPSAGLLGDSEAVSDVMTALAISTAPSESSLAAGSGSKEVSSEGEESGEQNAKNSAAIMALQIDASSSAELNQLAEAVVRAAKALDSGAAPAWTVLRAISLAISESTNSGPARFANSGRAPLYAVTTLQANVRVQAALLRALVASLSAKQEANAGAVLAIVPSVVSCVDVAFDVGRRGRDKMGKGATALDANKEDNDQVSAAAQFEGSEAEQTAVKSTFEIASHISVACLKSTLDLLCRLDTFPGKISSTAEQQILSPSFGQSFAYLFGNKVAVECGSGVLAVKAVSGVSVLEAKGVDASARTARLATLGSLGVYRAAVNGLSSPPMAENEQYSAAVIELISKLMKIADVKTLGLDKQSLLAVNAIAKRYVDNETIARDVTSVAAGLESVYQEQSGAAFEGSIKGTLSALTGAKGYQRFRSPEGKFYYTKDGGSTSWETPAPVLAMMDAMAAVDMMSRKLEEEAVTAVHPEVINGMVTTLRAHEHDPGIAGVMLNAVGKLAANADNHEAIITSNVLPAAVKLFRKHGHLNDPRVCEGLASLILPLSFEQHFVKSVLSEANVIPLLIEIIVKYNKYCTTFALSSLAWPPSGDYNEKVKNLKADTPDADERNKELPRLAQMCVQSLANLACDNEPDETGQSSVTRIVSCGGIEALGELMSLHLDNPRLLEDSICALSNMAFVSDTIQLSIGRSCMDTVCTAATRFNSDSYLFQMTLRAIGNLTRCDENIMRAVGYGVIKGMVEGMTKHNEDPAVLQLCADVIGNMASVDDKKVGRAEGVKILMECSSKRGKVTTATGNTALTPTPPPPKPGAPKAPRPPNYPKAISNEQLMAVVEKAESLKEAVCTVLYEDGAPRALVEAMTKHYRNADLAGSCLRAMHYIGASKDLVTRMVDELALVDQVVYIMRSIDYRPDVLRRGARVLGLVVGTDNLKDKVLMAGAPVMLLQAIETHKAERELCISCYSVLAMARSGAVVSAVQEMQAVDTAVTILRLNSSDHEFVGVLLELLWGWAAEADLASTIAARAGPTLTQLLESYARNTGIPDRLQHLNYILNLMIALVRQRVEPTLLTSCGLVPAAQVVVDGIVGSTDGNVMLQQRSLVMQTVTIMMEMSKPQPKDKETPAVVSKSGCDALISAGAGPMLEKILSSYKAVPDPRVAGQLLYDQSMCERVHGVLQDMIANGYNPANPVTLDAPEDGDAPAALPGSSSSMPPGSAPQAPQVPLLPASKRAAGSLPLSASPEVHAEITALQSSGGRLLDVWTADGKTRKAKVTLSADSGLICVCFEDGKKEQAQFATSAIKGVLLNVPAGGKKKSGGIFGGGKQAKAERSVVLEDADGNTIFHFEADSENGRGSLAGAFAAISKTSPRV